MLDILKTVQGEPLTEWEESGQLSDAVFRVTARVPMKFIGTTEHSGFPFDVDLFFKELQLDSANDNASPSASEGRR
jgi:hypothetical protein